MKRASVFLAAATLLALGCGSKATITGTVTYKGQPIHEGGIVFAPESGGRPVSAIIKDGKYTAEKVPPGPAKVSITSMYSKEATGFAAKMGGGGTPELTKKMEGPPPDAPLPPEARRMMEKRSTMGEESKKGVKIPDKYADPDKSGLTYTVQPGSQTKDFNLE
jgi:hypothetical protein